MRTKGEGVICTAGGRGGRKVGRYGALLEVERGKKKKKRERRKKKEERNEEDEGERKERGRGGRNI